jgi:hypothetical protein
MTETAAYADDWILKLKNLFVGTDAFQAILEQFYQQLAPVAQRKPYMGKTFSMALCSRLLVNDTNLRIKNSFPWCKLFHIRFYLNVLQFAREWLAKKEQNHEALCIEVPLINGLCPDGQKNFTDFIYRFNNLPDAFASASTNTTAKVLANQAKLLSNPPFWYSYEYGMAHIVMIDTVCATPQRPPPVL